jgi:hypothetical protein
MAVQTAKQTQMLIDVEGTRHARGRHGARALPFPDLVTAAEAQDAAQPAPHQAIGEQRAGADIMAIDLANEAAAAEPVWPAQAGAFPINPAYQHRLATKEQERRELDATTEKSPCSIPSTSVAASVAHPIRAEGGRWRASRYLYRHSTR